MFNYETGAAAHLNSAQIRTVKAPNGILTPELVEPLIRTMNDWDPITRVVEIENTANKAGGTCYSEPQIAALRTLAQRYHLGFHIDGARIWNAHIATGIPLKTFGTYADTLSVCFSKGLGAPAGSIVIGNKQRVKQMRRLRKMWGGGMRQVGVLAAAAEYAFDHHLELLAGDHRRARVFGEAIVENPAFRLDLSKVQSNIVIFECVSATARAVNDYLYEHGILMSAFSPTHVRAVFHFQIDDAMLEKTVQAIRAFR
jgi:threonine aldolase